MRTVSIPGPEGRLAGVEAGSHGPPVLFVHGYPDDHEVWSKQLELLAPRFRVAAFDLRGVGGSEAAPGNGRAYDHERIAADLDALVAHVGGGRPVHLVGHDWGSMLCWFYVANPGRAGRVASFTSISGPHPGIAAAGLQRALKGPLRKRYQAVRQLWRSQYMVFFKLPRLPERTFRRAPVPLWRAMLRRGGVPDNDPMLDTTEERALSRLIPGLGLYRQNIPARAPKKDSIDVPVQIVVPKGDPFVTAVLHERVDAYATDVTRREIDGGHWCIRSHPEPVARLIEEFVMAQERSKS